MWQPNAYDLHQTPDRFSSRVKLSFASVLLLFGCGLTPDVTERDFAEDTAGWPGLLPQSRLSALAGGEALASTDIDADMQALQNAAQALRTRAARLSGPVLSNPDRQKLEGAARTAGSSGS